MYIACVFYAHLPVKAALHLNLNTCLSFACTDGQLITGVSDLLLKGEIGMQISKFRSKYPDLEIVHIRKDQLDLWWSEQEENVGFHFPRLESEDEGILFAEIEDPAELEKFPEKEAVKIGLSDCRNLARLAAERSSTGYFLKLNPHKIESFLSESSVKLLIKLNFDDKIVQRLEWFGFNTLLDVYKLNQKQLRAQFGMEGVRLYQALRRENPHKRVSWFTPTRKVIRIFEHEDEYPINLNDFEIWLGNFSSQITEEVHPFAARILNLSISTKSETSSVNRWAKIPLYTAEAISEHAILAWNQLIQLISDEVISLKLTLSGLANPNSMQSNLFEKPDLKAAIHLLNSRFPGVVRRSRYTPNALFPEDEFKLVSAS